MLRRLLVFLLGYLRIEVRGDRIEPFLNMALENGVFFWSVERFQDRLCAMLTIHDLFLLRPAARSTHTRLRILDRRGWPFIAVRLRRRPGLLSGALLCLAFLIWASGYVWFVNVKVVGPRSLDLRAIASVAAEAGLKPGVRRDQIDIKRVQQHIQQRLEEVSWTVIRLQGARAIVEVMEKEIAKKEQMAQCVSLVARKGGVVEQVVPFVGEPVVKKGDVVREGDLLVDCSLRYWQGGRPLVLQGMPVPPRESVARRQTAQARVMARIRYEEEQQVLLYREVPIFTGKQMSQWVLFWNEKPIIRAGGARSVPFSQYRAVRDAYTLPAWRNWKLPVELVRVAIHEVHVQREPIPISQVLQQAQEQMISRFRWILGPLDKILTPLEIVVVRQEKDYVRLRMTVETLEEIATPRQVTSAPRSAPL